VKRGAVYGLLAAALFGASAPLAKILLRETGPLVLAGLLYLGGGIGLGLYRLVKPQRQEARLGRSDLAPMLTLIVLGGAAAPVLLLFGLSRLSGVAGSLLLNLEAAFTMFIAITFMREHLSRAAAVGSALIVAGSAVLAYRPGALDAEVGGIIAVSAACLAWAIDNNLAQRLSLKDPLEVALTKTLSAGTGMLALALALGQRFPSVETVLAALALGAASYGASLLLDTLALRALGAAREAAYFATAPFFGAALALVVLDESPSVRDGICAALMLGGVALLLRERHAHLHTHERLAHEHAHVHDDHHQHRHDGPTSELHSHWHEHQPLTHSHGHVSDSHHRHEHD
jgi:drug/metabolite transporter (DMT)-like permease